jgi:hypothetical protein
MLDTSGKFLRYIVRWVTDLEDGTLYIRGYCVYDREDCKTLFEHADQEVCKKVLEMMLNDER